MNPARLIILAIALLAGIGAAMLVQRPSRNSMPAVRFEPAPTVDVLVASADIPQGNRLAASDLKWIAWPTASVPDNVIRRQDLPQGEGEFVGQLARAPLFGAEPIRREKLIRADGSGFLSAVLPPGKRAVAITTDNKGANTAGGFILPNDRVDVIRISRDDSNTNRDGGGGPSADTILSNVRVLAIGQNVQDKNGEKVVVGETATLELEPHQAELVALAQKTASLSLVLRSLQDSGDQSPVSSEGGLTLVRFGVTSRGVRQ